MVFMIRKAVREVLQIQKNLQNFQYRLRTVGENLEIIALIMNTILDKNNILYIKFSNMCI